MELALVFLPIAFILIGALVIWGGRQRQVKKQTVLTWPTAPAKILTSKAYEERKRNKDGTYTTEYRRSVEYEFVVGDKTIRSKRIDFTGESIYYIKSSCEYAIAAYPAGATVPVHYDPANPEECVLDAAGGNAIVLYLLGGLLISAGAALLYMLLTSAQAA